MVLQRDSLVPIWGWTEPGGKVAVKVTGFSTQAASVKSSARVTADDRGKWVAKLGPLPTGGPCELEITGPERVTLKNVMVGDVWLCSGQSNMEWYMSRTKNAEQEIAAADHPNIRLFLVPRRPSLTPQAEVDSKWQVCTPRTAEGFSAVAYFFGRHLNQEVKVPIGLIETAWSGTRCEAWTSAEAVEQMEDFAPAIAVLREHNTDPERGAGLFRQEMQKWWQTNDLGSAEGQRWERPEFRPQGWKSMKLPQLWEAGGLADFDGIVWFLKEIELPGDWAGKDLTLSLGPIDERDTTWFNGAQVGAMDVWNQPRNYKVPGRLVKTGRNVIAVRVVDTGGGGGIYGEPGLMWLTVADDATGKRVSLAGEWQYRETTPIGNLTPAPPEITDGPHYPSVLFNGMLRPVIPFAIKGVIWYQGEANATRGRQYRRLLPTMIRDWRARFGVGEFPFLIVQLANFMEVQPEPSDPPWAHLREAQLLTALHVPNCGLAVTIDIGETNDIHPRNKQDVGHRLALAARGVAYGQEIVYSGPVYRSMTTDGRKARLTFDHVGSGLIARGGGPLKGFAIAGADMKFVWAEAEIDGDTVLVWSDRTKTPVAVRYAWANNPVCNLYNKEGLPASPFRTDRD
jgi:sialate O-acetylesterase